MPADDADAKPAATRVSVAPATWRCSSPVRAARRRSRRSPTAAAPAGRSDKPDAHGEFPEQPRARPAAAARAPAAAARQALAPRPALLRRGRFGVDVMETRDITSACKCKHVAEPQLAVTAAAGRPRRPVTFAASVGQRHVRSSISSSTAFFTSTSALMTPAFCSARPAARIDSRCGAPILLMGQLGALLELLVDHRVGQLGRRR